MVQPYRFWPSLVQSNKILQSHKHLLKCKHVPSSNNILHQQHLHANHFPLTCQVCEIHVLDRNFEWDTCGFSASAILYLYYTTTRELLLQGHHVQQAWPTYACESHRTASVITNLRQLFWNKFNWLVGQLATKGSVVGSNPVPPLAIDRLLCSKSPVSTNNTHIYTYNLVLHVHSPFYLVYVVRHMYMINQTGSQTFWTFMAIFVISPTSYLIPLSDFIQSSSNFHWTILTS